ncbi:MAG: hypothetical protein ACYDCQ_21000 [Dehalococcoidia bacterium]
MSERLRTAADAFLRFVTPRAYRADGDDERGGFVALRTGYLRAVVERSVPLSALDLNADGGAAEMNWPPGAAIDDARRLGYWPGQESRPDFARAYRTRPADPEAVEQPWNFRWDALPKRSAGPGFTREDYRLARERAREVARTTLGEALWQSLEQTGYLDVPSRMLPGITYRLRVGRRIEVLCRPGVESPWYFDFLCINPAYPLPEYEFFAHLYLYIRDQEEEVLRVAAPQPWDQALGRTF